MTDRDNFWLGLGAVGVLTAFFCLPFLRTIAWFSDEGILLHGADRMLRGETLYVDFFEFHPPGGFFVTLGWLRATGVSFVSARLLAIVVIVGIACLTYLACYRACRNMAASAIAALAWAIMSQGPLTQLSHHWFTTLLSLVIFVALLEWIEAPQSRYWLAVAGLAGGAVTMITSTRGALALLAGIAAFNAIRQHCAAFAVYCLAALVVPTLIILHLAAQGSLEVAFESVIVWPARHYASIQWLRYGANPTAQNVLLNLVFPLAALFVLIHIARQGCAALNDQVLRLSIAFGCAGFIGFLVRADTIHISLATPLVLPLLLRSARLLDFEVFRRHRNVVITGVTVLAITPAWTFLSLVHIALSSPTVETPRGFVKLVTPETISAVPAIRRIMEFPTGDTVFFYPYSPLLPFLTARVHPAKVDHFVPNYTTAEQFEEACVSAMNSATWVLVDRNIMAFWQQAFPAMRNPAPPERIHFEAALERGFSLVEQLGDFELWAARHIKSVECRS